MNMKLLNSGFFAILMLIVISMSTKARASDLPDCDQVRDDDQICMACNVYHEAATTQTVKGSLAVATSTTMRVANKTYPNNVCSVVWQPKQFSWTHDGKPDRIENRNAWKRSIEIARLVTPRKLSDEEMQEACPHITATTKMWDMLEEQGVKVKRYELRCEAIDALYNIKLFIAGLIDKTGGATHYHATYVKPPWSRGKRPSAIIEDHVFYVDVR